MQTILRWTSVALLLLATDIAGGQSETSIPSKVVESWSYLIGDWQIEGRVGSESLEGTAHFQWSAGDFCYFGEQVWEIGSDGRNIHLALVGGWDAAKNETVEHGFSSIGTTGAVHFESPQEESTSLTGRIEVTGVAGERFSGTVEQKRLGPNEFQLITTVDDEVVHSLTYVRKESASGDAPKIPPGGRQ